jgi:hypothetical protein
MGYPTQSIQENSTYSAARWNVASQAGRHVQTVELLLQPVEPATPTGHRTTYRSRKYERRPQRAPSEVAFDGAEGSRE